MTSSEAHKSGPARYRAKLAEAKALKMAELAMYREHAETVERDGREFLLVRIPDMYDFARRDDGKRR